MQNNFYKEYKTTKRQDTCDYLRKKGYFLSATKSKKRRKGWIYNKNLYI